MWKSERRETASDDGPVTVLGSCNKESGMPMRKVEVVLPLKLFSNLDITSTAPTFILLSSPS